mgnify:CR=1 FL=1
MPLHLKVPPRQGANHWYSVLNPESMQLLRANAAEPQWLKGFRQHLRFEEGRKAYENNSWLLLAPIESVLDYGMEIMGLWVGSAEVVAGRLSPASLPGLIVSAQQVVQMAKFVKENVQTLVGSATGGASDTVDILAIVQREPKIGLYRPPIETMPAPGAVDWTFEFVNVTFSYPSRPRAQVLRNFSAVFPCGKVTGVVGTSGCGKSTIFALLERMYEPQQGTPTANL